MDCRQLLRLLNVTDGRENKCREKTKKMKVLKSALCLNSSNLKANQIVSDILIAKKISLSLPL